MTTSKSLPDRPSLESLRKQAKKLARDRSLPLREAQLALARQYGFAGWGDLTAEVSKRLGKGLDWAVAQARVAIHDNDLERLKRLLDEYPALLSWHGDPGDTGLLGMATGAYGDAGDPERERWFTRAACAELLIDAGAIVTRSVCDGLVRDRARGLLRLFARKGLLPDSIEFPAALGDADAVRASLANRDIDLPAVNNAFMVACRFGHEAVASLLLDRAIALDPELGARVAASGGRVAFIKYLSEKNTLTFAHAPTSGPWETAVMERVMRAIHDDDLTAFTTALRRERWLLGDAHVGFQIGLVETAAVNDRGTFIAALLDLDPALVRHEPPPPSQAIEFALCYGHPHLVSLLTRVWPLPDDLPHAAGMGDLARVKRWFDEPGAPPAQEVLDTALAWSVINHRFEVAEFLLAHGADINTRWNSHEPASILHTLVFEDDYEAMQFLIDRGIDMTIRDYRWNSTAAGWARHGKGDEKMARWLEDAERFRPGASSRRPR